MGRNFRPRGRGGSLEGKVKAIMAKYGALDRDTAVLETQITGLQTNNILCYPYNIYDTKGGAFPTDTFGVGQTLFEGIGKTTGETSVGVDLQCILANNNTTNYVIIEMVHISVWEGQASKFTEPDAVANVASSTIGNKDLKPHLYGMDPDKAGHYGRIQRIVLAPLQVVVIEKPVKIMKSMVQAVNQKYYFQGLIVYVEGTSPDVDVIFKQATKIYQAEKDVTST